ncbi:MAG: hypothetical protein J0L69_06720 [Bacteroidetes bacterium]|nr:hypothetical protein [Bacteroidota bacterium]
MIKSFVLRVGGKFTVPYDSTWGVSKTWQIILISVLLLLILRVWWGWNKNKRK